MEKAKVLCLRPQHDFTRAGVEIPQSLMMYYFPQFDEEKVLKEIEDADFLLSPSHYPPISARLLERAKSLKLVQLCGSGYDSVDLEAAKKAKIPVARCPGQNSRAVAQLSFVLMNVLNRGILIADKEVKRGNYQEVRERLRREGTYELEGLALGIIGMGPIGREMAKIGAFFGARQYYYDIIHLTPAEEETLNVTFLEMEELLKISDVVTLHVPLNNSTYKLIGKREFSLMKQGAILINTSRGAIVDMEAMVEALRKNKLKGAAFDAFDEEPLPQNHFLLNLEEEIKERLILTPHIGGTTRQSQKRMFEEALRNILRVMHGETPRYVVNDIK